MADYLSSSALMAYVQALAGEIGPRQTTHPGEEQARAYVRRTLGSAGFSPADLVETPFRSADSLQYSFLAPILATLAGNLLSGGGRLGRLVGAAAGLLGALHMWQLVACGRQPLSFLYPRHPTRNLVAHIPARRERREQIVLIGHLDTSRQRATFAPRLKRFIPATMTAGTLLPLVNGLALLMRATGGGRRARAVQWASLLSVLAFLPVVLHDEKDGFVDGANDNATAVACLLGLGAHLKENPLEHSDVWLAFTAAEEIGSVGMHHLLDVYGDQWRNAWFIDLEMVGSEEIIYVPRHGVSYLRHYGPDAGSLALAEKTRRQHPELGVYGRPLVIIEEVGALRSRGYRGICLAGVGEDGWLENWHRYSDDVTHVKPHGIERAARFALAMMQELDARAHQV